MIEVAGSGPGSESGFIIQRHGSVDPDLLRIHTNMSWIRNTGFNPDFISLRVQSYSYP
jgi:hypothetical protein